MPFCNDSQDLDLSASGRMLCLLDRVATRHEPSLSGQESGSSNGKDGNEDEASKSSSKGGTNGQQDSTSPGSSPGRIIHICSDLLCHFLPHIIHTGVPDLSSRILLRDALLLVSVVCTT